MRAVLATVDEQRTSFRGASARSATDKVNIVHSPTIGVFLLEIALTGLAPNSIICSQYEHLFTYRFTTVE
jgi:hypothetical protein